MVSGHAASDRELSTYLWLWVRLVLVSVVSLWLYFGYVDVLLKPIFNVVGIVEEFQNSANENPSFYYGVTVVTVLKYVIGVLFWWRAVKVFVLLGWLFMFGVQMGGGNQTGRMATIANIGELGGEVITNSWTFSNRYEGKFWFGLIARANPSSDKIVRSRIEFLSLALFRWTFEAHEGRLFFFSQGHEERALKFRRVRHPHVVVPVKPGDSEIAKAVNELKAELVRQANRKK